jgi:Mlc titration factor MtfA (ptsG expression regulator)
MNDEESKLIVNASFILDNENEIAIKNINIDTLNKLNRDEILKIMFFKWYMYGNFDKIDLLGEEYIITNKTKKKIDLVRFNKNNTMK